MSPTVANRVQLSTFNGLSNPGGLSTFNGLSEPGTRRGTRRELVAMDRIGGLLVGA